MTNMHNHTEAASYIMFEDEDCPYCKIVELEKQLAEQGICEICKDKSVLVADKYREQNAKLIEALDNLMEWQVKNVKKWNNRAYNEAAAVIKEVKGE